MSGWSSIQTLVASLPISAFLGFGMVWMNCGSWKCPVTSAKYMSWLRAGRLARCLARATRPSPPFSSVAFGPSVWVLMMMFWPVCPEPFSEPQTVSVAAPGVMSAVSTSVARAWPLAASPDSSVPVESPTHTAGQPGSEGVARPDAVGYGVVNGLYWLMTSSSGIPVHAQITPSTPAFLASSSGTGSNMPCQAGWASPDRAFPLQKALEAAHVSTVPFSIPGEPTLDLIDRKSTRLNSSHLGISYAV